MPRLYCVNGGYFVSHMRCNSSQYSKYGLIKSDVFLLKKKEKRKKKSHQRFQDDPGQNRTMIRELAQT